MISLPKFVGVLACGFLAMPGTFRSRAGRYYGFDRRTD